MSSVRLEGRVVVITGAGQGLGRSYALELARRGAKVVVNDLGGGIHGGGSDVSVAQGVVDDIKASGGEAVANTDSVENGARIVECALDSFGAVDAVINNAGILRDQAFHKMSLEDWDLILRVHLQGAFQVTRAAWPHMRSRGYGRVVMTASGAGVYGNFGQANYAAAKLGLYGFAQALAIEGATKGILVNTIAPVAASRLTATVMPADLLAVLKPEAVTPLVVYLVSESCNVSGQLFEVGGGRVSRLRWERSKGAGFDVHAGFTAEDIARSWAELQSFEGSDHPADIADSFAPIARHTGVSIELSRQ